MGKVKYRAKARPKPNKPKPNEPHNKPKTPKPTEPKPVEPKAKKPRKLEKVKKVAKGTAKTGVAGALGLGGLTAADALAKMFGSDQAGQGQQGDAQSKGVLSPLEAVKSADPSKIQADLDKQEGQRSLAADKQLQAIDNLTDQKNLAMADRKLVETKKSVGSLEEVIKSFGGTPVESEGEEKITVPMPEDRLGRIIRLDKSVPNAQMAKLVANTDKIIELLFLQSKQMGIGFNGLLDKSNTQIRSIRENTRLMRDGNHTVAQVVQAGNDLELDKWDAENKQARNDLQARKKRNNIENAARAKSNNANADAARKMAAMKSKGGKGDKGGALGRLNGKLSELEGKSNDIAGKLAFGTAALYGVIGGVHQIIDAYGDKIIDGFNSVGDWIHDRYVDVAGGTYSSGEDTKSLPRRMYERWKYGDATNAEYLAGGAAEGYFESSLASSVKNGVRLRQEYNRRVADAESKAGRKLSRAERNEIRSNLKAEQNDINPVTPTTPPTTAPTSKPKSRKQRREARREAQRKAGTRPTSKKSKDAVAKIEDAIKNHKGEIKIDSKTAAEITSESKLLRTAKNVGQRAKILGRIVGKIAKPVGAALDIIDIYSDIEDGDYGRAAYDLLSAGVWFIPGVGPALGIAMMAAEDLVNGGPLSDAMVSYVKSANPFSRFSGSSLQLDGLQRMETAAKDGKLGITNKQYDQYKKWWDRVGDKTWANRWIYNRDSDWPEDPPIGTDGFTVDDWMSGKYPNTPAFDMVRARSEMRDFRNWVRREDLDARYHTDDISERALNTLGMSNSDRLLKCRKTHTGDVGNDLGGWRHRVAQLANSSGRDPYTYFDGRKKYDYRKYKNSIYGDRSEGKGGGKIVEGAGGLIKSIGRFLGGTSDGTNWMDLVFGTTNSSIDSDAYSEITNQQALQNARTLLPFFKEKLGLTDEQAIGLMGVLYAESGLNPAKENTVEKAKYPISYGEGIAQWSNARKLSFANWYRNNKGHFGSIHETSVTDQAEYLVQEFINNYGPVLDMLRESDSIDAAVDIVRRGFENGNGTTLVSKDTIRKVYAKNYPGDAYVVGHNRRAGFARGLWNALGLTPALEGSNVTLNNDGFAQAATIDSTFNPYAAAQRLQEGVYYDKTLGVSKNPRKGVGRCASYVADALIAGGLPVSRRESAYQYEAELRRLGFRPATGAPQIGDVSVTGKDNQHVHGHIAMWDGSQWISDFVQSGERVYANSKGAIRRYRHPSSASVVEKAIASNYVKGNTRVNPMAIPTGSNSMYQLAMANNPAIPFLNPNYMPTQTPAAGHQRTNGEADNEGQESNGTTPTIVNNSPSIKQGDTIINNNQQYITNITSNDAAVAELM